MSVDDFLRRKKALYYQMHRAHALAKAKEYREKHIDELREKQRKLYWERRNNGICTICGTAEAEKPHSRCATCRAYQIAYAKSKKREAEEWAK